MDALPGDIAVDSKRLFDSTPFSAASSQRQECSPCNEEFLVFVISYQNMRSERYLPENGVWVHKTPDD
jgi:hypothetical protein